jgi:hypothetical protein
MTIIVLLWILGITLVSILGLLVMIEKKGEKR